MQQTPTKPVDWDKRIVIKIKDNRMTAVLSNAEGQIMLTPREARLAGRVIVRQQRIDSNKARLVLRREQRKALTNGA